MRLIDAEALKDDGANFVWSRFADGSLINKEIRFVNREQIDNAPTIEAIPIDFIKQAITDKRYILARASEKTAPYYEHAVRALEMLLWEWEKENGRYEKSHN